MAAQTNESLIEDTQSNHRGQKEVIVRRKSSKSLLNRPETPKNRNGQKIMGGGASTASADPGMQDST